VSNSKGMTLIEVLVALAVLVGSALPLVALAHAELIRTAQVSREEARYNRASQTMTRIALLLRTDLERRLGDHELSEFIVSIQRPSPDLFRLAVADAAEPAHALLVTVVYRPPRGK
jgi:prepilin-type N-terminal cleavage/methylation domain-containing protein